MKEQTTTDYLNDIESEITNGIYKDLFVPTWDNKPEYKPPLITLNNEPILSYQNLTCLIAPPGSGKSSICESIVSSVINDTADNLGFKSIAKSVLFIDFERTETDVWNSFYRTMLRAKVNKGTELEHVKIVSFRNIPNAESRKQKIEELLNSYDYELLLFDGVGDLVNDTNSQPEAVELKCWVRNITAKYKTSIITTLHPNKGGIVPRGHVGSEMLRECENVLLIKVDADEKRTITTDFEHGKARNGKHANGCFVWSDEVNMFVSSEVIIKPRIVKQTPIEKLEHDELIKLVAFCNSEPKDAKGTNDSITKYLKENISYVKTSNNDIKEFIKYLVDNSYLITTKVPPDNRKTFYQYNSVKR
jgi:hypothetical protein